jgi:hypothetical protein
MNELKAIALELLAKWSGNTNALIAEMKETAVNKARMRRDLYASYDDYKARIEAFAVDDATSPDTHRSKPATS